MSMRSILRTAADKTKLGVQLEEFVKYLDSEESEIVTPEYGREVIRVIEEVLRQIEEYSLRKSCVAGGSYAVQQV